MNTIVLTCLAVLAFAANSILCRLALAEEHIDASAFTLVRLVSGALTLIAVTGIRSRGNATLKLAWAPATALAVYMASFSFGYLSLATGTGALILFASVQITMLGTAWWEGERLRVSGWIGMIMCLAGLAYLLAPGIEVPDPTGTLLMILAGLAWAIYTLLGRKVQDPLAASTSNFLLAALMFLIVCTPPVASQGINASAYGVCIALAAGAGTSALGYVVWFAALRGLAANAAAIVQLLVPITASLGGVILLSEPLSMRLIIASGTTCTGILLALAGRTQAADNH